MRAKLTPCQAEVIADLASITTDGSRHDPQYRLKGNNVSVQVRSMLMNGLIAFEDGRLVEQAVTAAPAPQCVDTKTAVSAMRDLLSAGRPRIGSA